MLVWSSFAWCAFLFGLFRGFCLFHGVLFLLCQEFVLGCSTCSASWFGVEYGVGVFYYVFRNRGCEVMLFFSLYSVVVGSLDFSMRSLFSPHGLKVTLANIDYRPLNGNILSSARFFCR